jgi:hypothetical protein
MRMPMPYIRYDYFHHIGNTGMPEPLPTPKSFYSYYSYYPVHVLGLMLLKTRVLVLLA